MLFCMRGYTQAYTHGYTQTCTQVGLKVYILGCTQA